MTKLTLPLVAAILVGFSLAPALAAPPLPSGPPLPFGKEEQVPIGSNLARVVQRDMLDREDTLRVLRELGRCLATRNREISIQFLRAAPGSRDDEILTKQLVGSPTSCLRHAEKFRLDTGSLRGAIAEALLSGNLPPGQFVGEPAPPPEEFAAFAASLYGGDLNGLDNADRALLIARWLAYCVAYEDPAAIKSLLAVRHGAPEEPAAFKRLNEPMGKCMMADQKLEVDKVMVRALVAEALARRALQ